MKLFFAKTGRGEMPMAKAKEWAHETTDIKGLPEKVSKSRKSKKKKGKSKARKRIIAGMIK
ncbi:MAG: hypothetical protein AABX71_01465 [Nanoarchaeota archaeon]